jgi:hypothetical protein
VACNLRLDRHVNRRLHSRDLCRVIDTVWICTWLNLLPAWIATGLCHLGLVYTSLVVPCRMTPRDTVRIGPIFGCMVSSHDTAHQDFIVRVNIPLHETRPRRATPRNTVRIDPNFAARRHTTFRQGCSIFLSATN